jgi:hypothetical protein
MAPMMSGVMINQCGDVGELIIISGSVRNTATLLEVLVARKIAPTPGLDPASASLVHRCCGVAAPKLWGGI